MSIFECENINLKRGSNNNNVKILQEKLKELGFYTRQVDGDFGTYTESAVKAFQTKHGLTSDGIFGKLSCKKLNDVLTTKDATTQQNKTNPFNCDSISLKKGSAGDNVKKLQTILKELGFYTRQVDGDFGTYTETAVKQLQNKQGNDPDGWFGPKTCRKLTNTLESKSTNQALNVTKDTTPEAYKKMSYELKIMPDVVVLPETEVGEDNTKTNTGGAINTDTSFDCTKINLKKGSKGDDVKKLQTVLKARGYYNRQVDGEFGAYTEKAVKALQTAQGNDPDGWFGQKTCAKLQGTSTTSNNATGTSDTKNKTYTITTFKGLPQITTDKEALTEEITVTIPYTYKTFGHIRKLQKTQFTMKKGTDIVKQQAGYISDIKISNEDSALLIELSIVNYIVFLEQTVEYEEKTAKRSELIKELIELAGLKPNVDTTGLKDDEYTIKIAKATTTDTGEGGGLVNCSGQDCTGHMQTNGISKASFNIDECGGNTKIGNSSANYAAGTKGMSGKEAILDVYRRFKYGRNGNGKAYDDNEICPQKMWNANGGIYGNCADISRLVKCIGDVHGMKVGIRHAYHHYYNLIEVDGKTYRFDCCFSSSGYMKGYGGELCNNLNKNGGPWQ